MTNLSTVRLQKYFAPLLTIFIIIGLVLFGLAIFSTGRQTTITITPKQTTISTTLSIPISATNESTGGTLPATVKTDNLSATATATPTATGALVDAHATGTMTVTNTTGKAQPLTSGTRFRSTDGQIFRSQSRIDVPAGGKTTVTVVADTLGLTGNVPAGRFIIVALWAGLQDKIYGQTDQAMTGGQVRQGSSLDIATLTKASDQAATEIRTQFGESTVGEIKTLNPLSVTTDPAATTPSDSYRVTVTMTGRTISYDPNKLESILRPELEKKLAAGYQIDSIQTPTITIATESPALTLSITASALSSPKSSADLFQPAAYTNQSAAAITKKLVDSGQVKSVNVSLSPPWVTITPGQADRIKVVLTAPAS